MPSLLSQKDFRAVQNLPFCYLCGKYYVPADKPNRDHLPAQCIFLPPDREPLRLPTHIGCNSGESLTDEKIGQLVALRYGKVPTDVEHRRLKVQWFPKEQLAALTNLDVDGAVWRWVRGCHAALYGEPFVGDFSTGYPGALVTPFPRAPKNSERADIEPLKPQHLTFVKTIKLNRALRNLDRVCSNKGKFVYECVWHQADNDGPWICIFAIDLYDWRDLGRVGHQPARGCAGFYMLQDGRVPDLATRGRTSSIIIPNLDALDPFGP